MRKYCFFLTCLFLFSYASAQWRVGGKIGANFSNLEEGERAEFVKQRVGFQAGAVSDCQINRWLSLQGEVLFAQYHVLYDNYLLDMTHPIETVYPKIQKPSIRTYEIDVPIMAKFTPFQAVRGFKIETGVQPGFFLKERISADSQHYERTDLHDRNIVNCSLLLGLAFEFPANWFIETRFDRGLTDIYHDLSGLKTSAVQLSVGYLFHW